MASLNELGICIPSPVILTEQTGLIGCKHPYPKPITYPLATRNGLKYERYKPRVSSKPQHSINDL